MSDTSPHTFFYESKQADVACDLPKEGIAIAFRQSDGGSIAAVIIQQAQHKANLERIRQLEIERDDYKAYTVATMNGWDIRQTPQGTIFWWSKHTGDERLLGPHPTWYLAARAAMKEVRNASAGIAAEYLDDTAGGIGGGR